MAIRPARSTASVAFSLALAAFVSGCGSGKEKSAAPTPAAAPAPAPAPAPGVPEAAAPGESPSVPYPADFPSDVPRYPGSKITSANTAPDGAFAVTIDTPDGVEAVAKFFGDGFSGQGWETSAQAIPDGTLVTAEKGGATAQALVHPGGQGTLVELIVARPE
jgi:hypothetical protein